MNQNEYYLKRDINLKGSINVPWRTNHKFRNMLKLLPTRIYVDPSVRWKLQSFDVGQRERRGREGKKISLSFQALPVLYSYMQQSNVPQLEGNSICAAVRNAKYIPEYMVTGRKYTQCRGTCLKELESSFPFPFAKCVISFQLFTTCSRNVDRRIEESFEKKKRPCQISTSINQGTKQLFLRNPPPLL